MSEVDREKYPDVLDILVRGNRVSGLEETASPDNGNRKLITHASFYRAHKLPALKYPY